MVQTIVAILALVFFALIIFLTGYAIGRSSTKRKNKKAGIDTPQSSVQSDGDVW